jgi:hypothetical protein
VEDCVLESSSKLPAGVDDSFIVDKSRRTNEHIAIFLDAFITHVSFMIESSCFRQLLSSLLLVLHLNYAHSSIK